MAKTKIQLGKKPTTFKHKVEVPLLDGDIGIGGMLYRYRTRIEFGEFLDQLFGDARVKLDSPNEEDVAVSLKAALEKTRDTNADYILQIAEGWNLESEFNRENVAQLCDELPGVALAIINVYRSAITEGRLGN